MRKVIIITLAILVCTSVAMAQFAPAQWSTQVPGGVTPPPKGFTIDKLGAHQNGGRGCVGCHAPHSGARGNGGTYKWNSTTSQYESVATQGVVGDEVLWGEDLGPIYTATLNFPTGNVQITENSPSRQITGIAMCLSCHDGNVAKGAMMTNQSFEQVAGMLPANYGQQPIPTLLGADGGSFGNYGNDHPVGPNAKIGNIAIKSSTGFFQITSGAVGKGPSFAGSAMEEFYKNYGLPQIVDARAGAGFAVDTGETNVDNAYVVCTTCHTPHSMYTTTAKLNGVSKGTVPTFFFLAAPYNPGANTANGTKASSATQFCRQCHFTGAGGSNEGSGISIPTAF
jgi:hypothetical protein